MASKTIGEYIDSLVDDPINPSHYTYGSTEVIDVIRDATGGLPGFEGYLLGNALKYMLRCYHKHDSPIDDLKKAMWYVDKLIEVIGEGEE